MSQIRRECEEITSTFKVEVAKILVRDRIEIERGRSKNKSP